MAKPSHRIAILHCDSDVSARLGRLAGSAGFDVVRPTCLADLPNCLNDPLICAILIDLPSPREGGVQMLESLCTPSSHVQLIVVTDGDQNSLTLAQSQIAAKGLNLTITPLSAIEEAKFFRQLASAGKKAQSFGPADLDDCIQDQRFRVEYQPKVSLLNTASASQFGVEALCRIRDPRFGPVSPDKFIPMAERCGLIAKLSDAVTCQAFQDWQSWKRDGLCVRLALNVSPMLLGDSAWSESFLRRCAEFKMEPKWVTLEITETAAGATNTQACEILTGLQRKGFALSIDDFGTGFSSLATLYRLPVAEMKIDKSFVLDLQDAAGARNLVESAVSMAKRMGIKVVAEGVENEKVFQELRNMGCHEVQGFFVGRSMPAEAVVPFFTGWKKKLEDGPEAEQQKGLPKIAVLQAILNDILSDRSLDIRAAAVGPYGDRAKPIEQRDDTKALIRSIPPLVLEGKTLASLALCHSAIRRLRELPTCNDMRSKITQLQSHLERELPIRGNLEIYTPQGMFRMLPRNAVTLGRASPGSRVDIPIKCRWFSNGEKNLRLFEKSAEWFIEDLGSAHGHMMDKDRLVPKRPYQLPVGKTLIQIRLASGAIAPLSVLLTRPSPDQNCLVIGFDYDGEGLRAELGEKDWAELEEELSCTWIIFSGKINIGESSGCALALDDCRAAVAASLDYSDGFWIRPVENPFTIDGIKFEERVPLMAMSEVVAGQCRLVVREMASLESVTASKSAPGQGRPPIEPPKAAHAGLGSAHALRR